MNINRFSGKRLKEALQFRGKKMTELAVEIGISKQLLSLYANDSNTPPFENVIRISQALNFPIDYFMTDDLCTVTTGKTYFRSQASATKRSRNSQKIKLEYVAKMYNVLLNYVNFPELNLPHIDDFLLLDDIGNLNSDESYEKIERIVEIIRQYWRIGSGPVDNLQYILESNGIIVTGFNDVDSNIDAFSQQLDIDGHKIYVIALSIGAKPIERLRFDMAHELGHIIMHSCLDNNDDVSKDVFNAMEKQANFFASALLLPKESFTRAISSYPTNVDYYKSLKTKWKVSMQAMMYRTRQLGLVTDNQFQYMMRIVSKNGWRTKEPGDVPGQIRDTIFQGAIDLLFDGGYLTLDELLGAFAHYGVILSQCDLENLMCLKEGTLKREAKVLPFISVKSDSE